MSMNGFRKAQQAQPPPNQVLDIPFHVEAKMRILLPMFKRLAKFHWS
jgi:hypothetical protein